MIAMCLSLLSVSVQTGEAESQEYAYIAAQSSKKAVQEEKFRAEESASAEEEASLILLRNSSQ